MMTMATRSPQLLFMVMMMMIIVVITTTTTITSPQYTPYCMAAASQDTADSLLRLTPLPTFHDTTTGREPFTCEAHHDHQVHKHAHDDDNDDDEECDELSVDFALSRTLSTPFAINVNSGGGGGGMEGLTRGYLHLRVAVANATGDALQLRQGGSSMKLILEDADLSTTSTSATGGVSGVHSQKSLAAFFQRTVVTLVEPDSDGPNRAVLTFDVKVPLSAHATIDTLPRLLRFRIEKHVNHSSGSGSGNGRRRRRRVKPVAITYGHDTVVLSADLFRSYFNNTYFDHLQRVSAREFNVLFFGVMGSGKSTQINTIISALGDRVHRIAETGGGSRHHTQKFAQYRLHDIVDGLGDIRINLYDTWGLGDGRWKASTLFQSIVKGELPLGHTMHTKLSRKVVNATLQDKSHHRRKIHSVLLFLSVDSAFDNEIVQQIRDTMDAAMRNDINPIIVVTMTQDKTDLEMANINARMQNTFRCPIFINDVYLDHMREKVFGVDQNALSLLEMALRAASDHLYKQHAALNTTQQEHLSHEKKMMIFLSVLLCLVVSMVIVAQRWYGRRSQKEKSQPQQVQQQDQQDPKTQTQEFPFYQDEDIWISSRGGAPVGSVVV